MARTISVKYLARVEGEGGLTIRYRGKKPTSVELRIFEPPRFFEALLRGRSHLDPPDITARICGICPVAYQMSACRAIEDALDLEIPEPIARLRRLLYCGEWIESHGLHVFFLHAPDFLGCADAVEMAKRHRDVVVRALAIKKAGNAIVTALGGREIHPINVRIGGFYRAPARSELTTLVPGLEAALAAMRSGVEWLAGLDFPEFERDYEFVALRHPTEYPAYEGRIVSNKGLDITAREYDEHFREQQVPHSTALHSVLNARGAYVCGPLARINLNFDRLGSAARETADRIGFSVPCNNPYKTLLARGLETVEALDRALSLIATYSPPERAFVDAPPRAATGYGCTEAPRGILYHRYRLASDGLIEDARIVPPTSQNMKSIEADLFELAPGLAELPNAEASWNAERAVRNYDPCISCSTHFLTLRRVDESRSELGSKAEEPAAGSLLIVALGQPAAGDDGVGGRVLGALREASHPSWVSLATVSDASALIPLLENARRVVIVDALVGVEPGSVALLAPEELARLAPSALSSHGLSVTQVLELSRALAAGNAPEIRILGIGIRPPDRYTNQLSVELRRAVELATKKLSSFWSQDG